MEENFKGWFHQCDLHAIPPIFFQRFHVSDVAGSYPQSRCQQVWEAGRGHQRAPCLEGAGVELGTLPSITLEASLPWTRAVKAQPWTRAKIKAKLKTKPCARANQRAKPWGWNGWWTPAPWWCVRLAFWHDWWWWIFSEWVQAEGGQPLNALAALPTNQIFHKMILGQWRETVVRHAGTRPIQHLISTVPGGVAGECWHYDLLHLCQCLPGRPGNEDARCKLLSDMVLQQYQEQGVDAPNRIGKLRLSNFCNAKAKFESFPEISGCKARRIPVGNLQRPGRWEEAIHHAQDEVLVLLGEGISNHGRSHVAFAWKGFQNLAGLHGFFPLWLAPRYALSKGSFNGILSINIISQPTFINPNFLTTYGGETMVFLNSSFLLEWNGFKKKCAGGIGWACGWGCETMIWRTNDFLLPCNFKTWQNLYTSNIIFSDIYLLLKSVLDVCFQHGSIFENHFFIPLQVDPFLFIFPFLQCGNIESLQLPNWTLLCDTQKNTKANTYTVLVQLRFVHSYIPLQFECLSKTNYVNMYTVFVCKIISVKNCFWKNDKELLF